MDRREFLRSTGAAAAASAVAATTTAAAEPAIAAPATLKGLRELRLSVTHEDGVAGPADWAHRLARNITDMSGGRFKVTPTFGVRDAAAAVRTGDADLCFDTVDGLQDIHRGFAFFAGLPGRHGLSPRDLQSWIAVGGGQALWDDLAADADLKPLLAAHTGAQSLLLSTRNVDQVSALSGMKACVGGLARDVARGLGMEVVSLAPGQKLSHAMQQGDVDVAECGGAITSYAAGLLTAAPYSAGTSINAQGSSIYLGVHLSTWEHLHPAEQAMLTAAAAQEFQLSLAEEEAHRPMLYRAPAADRVWPISDELAHTIERVAAAIVAHTAGTDGRSRRIADSLAAFKRSALAPASV